MASFKDFGVYILPASSITPERKVVGTKLMFERKADVTTPRGARLGTGAWSRLRWYFGSSVQTQEHSYGASHRV